MKIAFVIDDTMDKPDGVQQYVLTLGAWLRQQGHTVHYLAGASSRTDVPDIHSLSRNVKVRFNGNRLSIPLPADRRIIRRLLAREQYDVLHVQMPYSPMLAARVIAAAPAGTAVFGTFHILPISRLVRTATRLLGFWLRRSLRRFDHVFAVSPAAATFAGQSFGLTGVSVLPNVTQVAAYADAQPFERYRDGVPTIVFVGRLVPRKGCATLIRAAAGLRTRRPDAPFRVVVCGKGELESELRALAASLGVEDIVEFAGFIDEADKPRYIASADVAVFPSTGGESFGIVLLEAMAGGRPVVLAGDNDGYRSVLGDRPELLFPPGDAIALAEKLAVYLDDAAKRRAVLAWQQLYVQQFDVAAVGTRLLARYREVLRK